ncbi:MAG TPA: metal-dependent transcriptional regulator [Candidatus Borkfalkia excrementigallinarum]|uniref:Metal-dependent transcriptional regulator n=1 Tax=Candidatus Borkfalkia excrementigallinarum TaxID=2838506 RepID=A0A9D1ZU62_9FIRM|nr:metal-dependent transcriptional regulator [Candidatus Borkfalkia excrementigallinarum]
MIDNESGEDYLEAILRLSEGGKDVHSVDVAREMAVSKPAVTKAMRILKQKGYVDIVDNHIHFTAEGEAYAKAVYAKHRAITQFLQRLGVGAQNAEADACRMEHLISGETYAAICKFLEKE